MSAKTLTRMDLSEAVFREVGLSRNDSADLVERVLSIISDSLVVGESVKISSFGTFSVRDKAGRIDQLLRRQHPRLVVGKVAVVGTVERR